VSGGAEIYRDSPHDKHYKAATLKIRRALQCSAIEKTLQSGAIENMTALQSGNIENWHNGTHYL
jgi:hypothetical protein